MSSEEKKDVPAERNEPCSVLLCSILGKVSAQFPLHDISLLSIPA